jgi:hypothetical protein
MAGTSPAMTNGESFHQHIVSDCGAFALIGGLKKIFADYQP